MGKFNLTKKSIVMLVLIPLFLLGATLISNDTFRLNANQLKDGDYLHVGTPVTVFKCTPCHTNLDRIEYPTVKIPHNLHLDKGIQCQSCHNEYPHEPGKLNKPTMATCFNCHGATHGEQGGVAPPACNVCHPKNFNLMPNDHKTPWQQWKTKTDCVFCHEQKFCTRCHDSEEQVIQARMKFTKTPTVSASPFAGVIIKTDEPASVSTCSPCHDNWDRVEYPLIRFYHTKHFDKGFKCNICHTEFPHKDGKTKKPQMKICMSCHGMDHEKEGEIASPECLRCHRPNFNLMPASHDKKWARQEPFNHTKFAKKDKSQCNMCHNQQFCTDCHGLEPIPHRADWKYEHGSQATKLADNSPCHRCHKVQQFCGDCHHKVPSTMARANGLRVKNLSWQDSHFLVTWQTSARICYECHKSNYCAHCHTTTRKPPATSRYMRLSKDIIKKFFE